MGCKVLSVALCSGWAGTDYLSMVLPRIAKSRSRLGDLRSFARSLVDVSELVDKGDLLEQKPRRLHS